MAQSDDMKQFEEELEKKWNNWDRIQKRMAEREARRKKPKSGYEPPKKKNLKDQGKWKEDYGKLQEKTQQDIEKKYKDKKKKDKVAREKAEKKMREKVNADGKILKAKSNTGHGLSKAPPKTSNYAVNYAREQKKIQEKIDKKYAKKKEKEKKERKAKEKEYNEKKAKEKAAKAKKRKKNKLKVKKEDISESKSDMENNIEAKVSDNSDDEETKAKKKEQQRIRMISIGPNDTPIKSVENDEFDKLRKYAMSYKVQLNQKDKLKNTVLHHCCRLGKPDMLEYLLKHVSKTIVSTQNFQGNTALLLSIEHGCDAQGRYSPNSKLNRNKYKCFEILVGTKLKNKKTDLNLNNIKGFNALTYATLHKDERVLKLLLKHDPLPDLEFKTRQKKTALSIAVEYSGLPQTNKKDKKSYEAIAMLLLQAGASHRQRDDRGRTIEEMATGKIAKFIKNENYQIAVKGLTGCGLVRSTEFLTELIVLIADFAVGTDDEPDAKK